MRIEVLGQGTTEDLQFKLLYINYMQNLVSCHYVQVPFAKSSQKGRYYTRSNILAEAVVPYQWCKLDPKGEWAQAILRQK